MNVDSRIAAGRRLAHRPGNMYIAPVLSAEPPAWYGDALCTQVDPEDFYPEKGGTPKAAKAICSRCPVKAECLAWALAHNERFGVWGGLSERERRALKKHA